jgi:hypothetical protein
LVQNARGHAIVELSLGLRVLDGLLVVCTARRVFHVLIAEGTQHLHLAPG